MRSPPGPGGRGRNMLLAELFLCLCVSHLSQSRHSPSSSRHGKNSRLLTWGKQAKGYTAPISLYGNQSGLPLRFGVGRRERAHARLLQNIAAMNKQELVRENDRLLDQAGRKGKEGQDLLKPPYNTDWDQGQVPMLEKGNHKTDPDRESDRSNGGVRQVDSEEISTNAVDNKIDKEVRCIKKVMQVEETVYDKKIRCEHRITKKCHNTYITDYVATQEEKCDTSFQKRCHITFKSVMFSEPVTLCREPLEKVCSDNTVGEQICRTHYETTCETRFKEHKVEQDEPVCRMVTERKCRDLPGPFYRWGPGGKTRLKRQGAEEGDLLSQGEQCEEWPVQKCTLEKQTVTKVQPETACRKTPRKICAPSNCEFKPTKKVCREETREGVDKVPTEDCSLEPQEDCRMETVLIPRLLLKPNCIKIPKEVCVESRGNPKKVKKPVIKEWCYKPSDLKSPSSRLSLSHIFGR